MDLKYSVIKIKYFPENLKKKNNLGFNHKVTLTTGIFIFGLSYIPCTIAVYVHIWSKFTNMYIMYIKFKINNRMSWLT